MQKFEALHLANVVDKKDGLIFAAVVREMIEWLRLHSERRIDDFQVLLLRENAVVFILHSPREEGEK